MSGVAMVFIRIAGTPMGELGSFLMSKRESSSPTSWSATQMEMNGIPLLDALPSPLNADVVLDAIFGFSFKGAVRAPFDAILPALRDSGVPLVSVDIPSGWDVEAGPGDADALQPDVLVSLTMPKKCAAHFRGAGGHYLGGRFVPPALAKKYGFVQPPFPGTDQVVKL